MRDDRRTRLDRARAAAVEEGIRVAADAGRGAAAKQMLAAGIPFRVIVRVLSDPGKRR